jgi:hypothetical protein
MVSPRLQISDCNRLIRRGKGRSNKELCYSEEWLSTHAVFAKPSNNMILSRPSFPNFATHYATIFSRQCLEEWVFEKFRCLPLFSWWPCISLCNLVPIKLNFFEGFHQCNSKCQPWKNVKFQIYYSPGFCAG